MRWIVAALALPLMLAGCGSSPPTRFFALTAVGPSGGNPAVSLKGRPVQVGDIQLPQTVDRQAMVLRGPGTQVQVLGQDHWAAPLSGLMRTTLTEDLRRRLGDSAVVSPGAPAPRDGMQVLILNVQQFAADPSGQVRLDTDWSVGRGTPPKAAITRHADIRVDAGSAQPQAVAEGMSRALGELADHIAAAL